MTRGVSNRIAPQLDLQPVYRGTLNSYCALEAAGLTKNNKANAQAIGNTTIPAAAPYGVLAGAVVAVVAAGTVGAADDAADGTQAGIVGIAVRNAAGLPLESNNSSASGALTYLHGSGSVVEVPVYETVATDGTTALDYSTAAGQPVYASQNGLLTIATGLNGGVAGAGATVVGIILDPPTAQRPVLTIQLRV